MCALCERYRHQATHLTEKGENSTLAVLSLCEGAVPFLRSFSCSSFSRNTLSLSLSSLSLSDLSFFLCAGARADDLEDEEESEVRLVSPAFSLSLSLSRSLSPLSDRPFSLSFSLSLSLSRSRSLCLSEESSVFEEDPLWLLKGSFVKLSLSFSFCVVSCCLVAALANLLSGAPQFILLSILSSGDVFDPKSPKSAAKAMEEGERTEGDDAGGAVVVVFVGTTAGCRG